MNTDPEEYRLAIRASEGDREALAELVGRLRLWLFTLAYSELRHYEDAQDAVASALLRVCLRIHTLREPERMRQWMAAVVRNEARRLSGRRDQRLAEPDCRGAEVQVTEPAASLRLDVERALRTLPADQAYALTLFYLAGVSIREIARRTGRPEGTVKSWLHQGRRRLAQEMKEYAPMKCDWTAAIISTGLEPAVLTALSAALRAAGWSQVNTVSDYLSAAKVIEIGSGEQREHHLPEALAGARLIILDEWIEGRSAFELLPILNAVAERKTLAVGLLVEVVGETTAFSAWAAGVDLFLDKPVDPAAFKHFAERIRRNLESGG